jgi:hypothetical protein
MKRPPLLQVNSDYLKHYNKFRKLYFRIRVLLREGLFFHLSLFERNRLLKRLKLFYKRLLKFQPDLGIKFAGTTLAFTLICSVANSQGKFIERTGEENPLGGKINPFEEYALGEKIAPAFVDIDDDGDKDLFVGDTLGTIKYFRNTGNNVFQQQTGANNPFNGVDLGDEAKPAFVDIDDDGDFDAFIGELEGNLNFYRNDGNSGNPVFNLITGGEDPFDGVDVGDYSAPAFVDIDNDGDFDSFIGNKYEFIKYYENTSSGGNITFTERTGVDNPADSIGWFNSVPSFTDIDNDGDFDLFMGQKYGSLRQFENTGNSSAAKFEEKEGFNNIFFDVNMGSFLTPAFIDFDGDSDFDALVGNEEGKINYYNNEGTPGSPDFIRYQPIDVGYLAEPALIDIDNDGDLDAFIPEYYGTISNYKNDGNAQSPNFHKSKGINNPFYGDTIKTWPKATFVKIDNNNTYDVFIGTYDGTIRYFVNNGSQEIPVFIEQTGAYNPFNLVDIGDAAKLTFARIDNDEDQDLFIGCLDGNIKYFENTSVGLNITFSEQTGANNPLDGIDVGNSANPDLCDIDDDGDQDLFIGAYNGTIRYFENTSAGGNITFEEQTGLDNPLDGIDVGNYSSPYFCDIDNDSDLDLFVGEHYGTIKYYEHNYPPSVANEIPAQNALVNQPFGFTIPENTFYDHDAGDVLTYSSTLSDGNPLPGWLTFNPDTKQYSGTATVAGTLNIKVTVMDVASHSAFEIFDLVVTEETLNSDLQVSEQLYIYPVPARDFLNIQLAKTKTGPVDIEIVDISGRILLNERFNNISKGQIIKFDISTLSKGIYYINIKRGKNIINKKFIVN